MAAQTGEKPQLYTQLDAFIASDRVEDVVDLAQTILAENPNDMDAVHCEVVGLVRLSKFEAARARMDAFPEYSAEHLAYERAYCLYREHRYADALAAIEGADEEAAAETRFRVLAAQVHYRLNDFARAVALYDALASSDDVDASEVETNASAAYALATTAGGAVAASLPPRNFEATTYELAYNNALIQTALGRFGAALALLDEAGRMATATLEEEDLTEEEIEGELGVIKAQQGLLLHLQGKSEEAMQIFQGIVRGKAADETLLAVVSNNIIVLNGTKDAFDSKKKVRALTADALRTRLTFPQRLRLLSNRALLAIHTAQLKEGAALVDELDVLLRDARRGPDAAAAADCADWAVLLRAALSSRHSKSPKEAVAMLEAYVAEHADAARAKLTLAQLQLTQGNAEGASVTVASLPNDTVNLPALVAVRVQLAEGAEGGGSGSAERIFDAAIEYWGRSKAPRRAIYLQQVLRGAAEWAMARGKAPEAAAFYERLVAMAPEDTAALTGAVRAYALCDPEKAEAYAARFPPIDASHVDVDALEAASSQHSFAGGAAAAAAKRAAKGKGREGEEGNEAAADGGDTAGAVGAGGDALRAQKAKKKKARKPRLPKNVDLTVPYTPDPDRWLKKSLRSTFRKTRRQKAQQQRGGHQGGAVVAPAGSYEGGVSVSSGGGKQAAAVPPKPAASKKKGKGKKGGKR